MIPEYIVKQYLTYSEECGFTPLSRRTLLRILTVCSASVRKSLQGLDYTSSAGGQAFDDLADVVNRLGDEFMGMTWAREQKERLKSAKRYLKVDFKVKLKKNCMYRDLNKQVQAYKKDTCPDVCISRKRGVMTSKVHFISVRGQTLSN